MNFISSRVRIFVGELRGTQNKLLPLSVSAKLDAHISSPTKTSLNASVAPTKLHNVYLHVHVSFVNISAPM